jgi:DNA-binding transcriptional MerR regulator
MPQSPTRAEPVSESISGKLFVFAGRLASLSRREAAALVRLRGGHTRHHVTQRTSFLVLGDGGAGRRSNRKVLDARRLERTGARVRVIAEADFLSMLGLESATRLRDRYYAGRDVRRMFGLDARVLRDLEKMSVVSPIFRSNAERYYTFADLLVFRQVSAARARGISLAETGRRLIQARTGQMRFQFEGDSPAAQVVELNSGSGDPASGDWSADDWYNLGCEHDETPEGFEKARDAYRHALDLDPYHVGVLINLGNLFYDRDRIDDARQLYERALGSDPDNAVAHFNLGNVFDDLGDYQRAIRYFKESIRLRPENADAYFNLGLVYDRIGEVKQVRSHMRRYLELGSDGDMAEVAREYLQLTDRDQ